MIDNKTPIIIIGTGPLGRIALEIANSLDVLVYGFLTDEEEFQSQEINDILVVSNLGSKDSNILLNDENVKVIISEYDIDQRKHLVAYMKEFKPELISLVYPNAVISPFAKVGRGNLINAGCIINPNAMVGSFNVFDSRVTIEPDVGIGDYCTLQSGVIIGKGVQIHDEVQIGIGAVIYPGVHVGKKAIIGAGSIVMRDVAPEITVFGNPAQEV